MGGGSGDCGVAEPRSRACLTLRLVPPGRVTTYGEVARATGGCARVLSQQLNALRPQHGSTHFDRYMGRVTSGRWAEYAQKSVGAWLRLPVE